MPICRDPSPLSIIKPADDAASDADPVAGSSLADASVMKADGADEDADGRIMVATVASEASLLTGDTVVFTYTGKSPEMPERSVFMTEYDGMPVDGEDTVIVESGKDASVVDIVSDESFMIDDGGTLTVTVKLLDSDGNFATRSTNTIVTLNDGGAGGSFESRTVTIPAGEYHAETTYSATEAARVTITAIATGLTAEPQMVLADTNSPSIDADSITADPMYAKEDTTVTVSAMGTKARAANTVLFSIGSADGSTMLITDRPMTEDEDEPGTYSGTYPIQPETDPDGTYDVTVRIAGTDVSETASGALTLDKTKPMITGESIDMSNVMAGDEVTISATLSEASTVSADVSMLNAAEPTLLLEDADGDGMYSDSVMVTAADPAADGEVTITITASDAAGNEAVAATVMVTLDNTEPVITEQSIDMPSVMVGGMATISATLSEASTVSADVSMLNAADPMLPLEAADGEGEGMVYDR